MKMLVRHKITSFKTARAYINTQPYDYRRRLDAMNLANRQCPRGFVPVSWSCRSQRATQQHIHDILHKITPDSRMSATPTAGGT